MSDKADETISRARRTGEKVNESAHDEYNVLSKKMREKQILADDFVHEQPYMAIGIGILAGFGLGVIVSSLMCRRRD